MGVRVLFPDNATVVELQGVVDPDDNPIVTATIAELTLFEDDMITEVGNQSWPVDLVHLPASPGTWRAELPHTMAVLEGAYYHAKWVIDDGAGRHGEGWIDYQAQRRIDAAA